MYAGLYLSMRYTSSEVELARSTKIRIDKYDSNGTPIAFYTGSFQEHKDFDNAGKRLCIGYDDIQRLVSSVPTTIYAGYHATQRPVFRVRSENSGGVVHYNTLKESFGHKGEKLVTEWDGKDWTVCLDIDFHKQHRPDPNALLTTIATMHPRPCMYWLSKGGGAHLIYNASGCYTAEDFAAVASYVILQRFPQAAIEFLSRTRFPGELHEDSTPADLQPIRRLLDIYTDVDRDAYLESKQWKVGMRLPHTQCPVNPSERALGNSPPVCIRETHVFCYICQADGRKEGRQAGRFSYIQLAGDRLPSMVSRCVTNFVHWGHAKYVMGKAVDNMDLGRQLYRVLLKMKHGEDDRIDSVFTAGEPNGLIRQDGYWSDYNGAELKLKLDSPILRSLPHCYKKFGPVLTLDEKAVEWLTQTSDHSERGYYPVFPVNGWEWTKLQEKSTNHVITVMQPKALRPENMKAKRLRYVEGDVEGAWHTLETLMPGIDRKLIELLLVQRGCTEYGTGILPMLFVTGPAGAGKTGHVYVASEIAGDSCADIKYARDQDRFFNSILVGKRNNGYLLFDEFFKAAKVAGVREVDALETMLFLKPTQNVYLIYIGNVPIGTMPAMVWVDTDIPDEVRTHEQIGRRVFHYHLPTAVSWEKPLADAGISRLQSLREDGNNEVIQAMNVIASHVMDKYFTGPAVDFAEVCTGMGVKRLRDSDSVQEKYRIIRDLFDKVCQLPDIVKDSSDYKRFSKRGNKILTNGMEAYTLLTMLQAEGESERVRALEEADLKRILGLQHPARCEIKPHGQKRAIRFVSLDNTKVNHELCVL